MVVSVHIAEPGLRDGAALLRAGRKPPRADGMRYGETAALVPLGGAGPRVPPRRAALIASWDDDAAIDRFLTGHPFAESLAGGWHIRLEPRRIVGHWPEMPELPAEEIAMDPDEPAAVLTLGRPRLLQLRRFLRTSRPAERLAVRHPALVVGTAMARPPRVVATFSIWRTVREMRDYTLGRPDKGHLDALREDRRKTFHHREAFVRFRPYAAEGRWDGREPLSETRSSAPSGTAAATS